MPTCPTPWSVVVLSSRESAETLERTITSVLRLLGDRECIIHVVVNGNPDTAAHLARSSGPTRAGGQAIRVWHVPAPNKCLAWNLAVHQLLSEPGNTIFIDGYVNVDSWDFSLLERAWSDRPDLALIGGFPRTGRSSRRWAQQAIKNHWIHGNFFAISGDWLRFFREGSIHLPLGTYYHDSLIQTIVLHTHSRPGSNLDRIRTLPEITWSVPTLRWWSPADLFRHYRRVQNQQIGKIQLRAFRWFYIESERDLANLPWSIDDLVLDWSQAAPEQVRELIRSHPLCRFFVSSFRRGRFDSLRHVRCEKIHGEGLSLKPSPS